MRYKMFRMASIRFWALGAAALSTSLLASGAAQAVQINVNGFCTIEMAFETLNSLAPVGACEVGTGTGDIIQLGGTNYTVTQPLSILRPATVRGDGSGTTQITAEGLSYSELFFIYNGGYPGQQNMNVVFEDVSLYGGDPSNLQVTGIYAPGNADPTVTLFVQMYRSRVSYFTWAGVYLEDASLWAENSTFQYNSSPESGGGLHLVERPEFEGNAGFELNRCAVIGNHSDADGGGVFAQVEGIANIRVATLSSNTANGTGGGLFSANQNYLHTFDTTVAFNQASVAGGGFAAGSSTSFNFNTSIISNNFGPSTSPDGYVPGGLTVAFYDCLVGNTTGIGSGGNYVFNGADLRNRNPLLDPNYFDMGGASHTVVHRLLPGSPAFDYFWTNTDTDQRGFPAPRDADGNGSKKRDLGAYEYDPYWQTEKLLTLQNSDPHVQVSTPGSDTSTTFSNGIGTNLQSNGVNDFVIYTVPVPAAGNYNVRVRVRKGSNRGKFQLGWSNNPAGPWTNIGGVQDLYSSSTSFQELNLNSATPTNISSTGQKYFRFLVTGKNGSSSGYQLVLDYIRTNKL